MTVKKKSNFDLGVWFARQELAKKLVAICLMNDAEQTKQKIQSLAQNILDTEE